MRTLSFTLLEASKAFSLTSGSSARSGGETKATSTRMTPAARHRVLMLILLVRRQNTRSPNPKRVPQRLKGFGETTHAVGRGLRPCWRTRGLARPRCAERGGIHCKFSPATIRAGLEAAAATTWQTLRHHERFC